MVLLPGEHDLSQKTAEQVSQTEGIACRIHFEMMTDLSDLSIIGLADWTRLLASGGVRRLYVICVNIQMYISRYKKRKFFAPYSKLENVIFKIRLKSATLFVTVCNYRNM